MAVNMLVIDIVYGHECHFYGFKNQKHDSRVRNYEYFFVLAFVQELISRSELLTWMARK